MVTKNELQNIADAAAQAGSRALGRGEGTGSIIAKVQEVASENYAAGKFIEKVIEEDIVIGKWDNMMVPPLAPTNTNPNAVKVTVRRDTKANGPISTFFAGVLKISTVDVWASGVKVWPKLLFDS
jgi:Flp pilus assembly protein TadG